MVQSWERLSQINLVIPCQIQPCSYA